MINSIVPIKWDLVELICVTYKWAWVGPDISCIILTNNLTFRGVYSISTFNDFYRLFLSDRLS